MASVRTSMFSPAALFAVDGEMPKQLGQTLRNIEKSFASASAKLSLEELHQDLLPFFAAEEKARTTEDPVKKIQALQETIEVSQKFREKYGDFLQNDEICSLRRSELETRSGIDVLSALVNLVLGRVNDYQNLLEAYQSLYQYLDAELRILDRYEDYIMESTYSIMEIPLLNLVNSEEYKTDVQQTSQRPDTGFWLSIIDATAKAILWTIAQNKARLDRNRQWDEQFERDVTDGKLEDFARSVMTDFAAGNFDDRQLQERCNALSDRDRQQVKQGLVLLKTDPTHPSLHLKKVGKYWLAKVSSDRRLLGIETDNNILWCWIGTQEEQKEIIDEESIDWLIEAVEEWSKEDQEYAREVEDRVLKHII